LCDEHRRQSVGALKLDEVVELDGRFNESAILIVWHDLAGCRFVSNFV
jgi:hypothetical protein